MAVDRPRRARFEEPDNVESYVAKRSLGFTQADSDPIAVRPARAARALEPNAAGTRAQKTDRVHLVFPAPPRPRGALPAEPLSRNFDEPKATPDEPTAAARRAIVDLEPTPSSQSVVPSQPAAPVPVQQAASEGGSITHAPPREPAIG